MMTSQFTNQLNSQQTHRKRISIIISILLSIFDLILATAKKEQFCLKKCRCFQSRSRRPFVGEDIALRTSPPGLFGPSPHWPCRNSLTSVTSRISVFSHPVTVAFGMFGLCTKMISPMLLGIKVMLVVMLMSQIALMIDINWL